MRLGVSSVRLGSSISGSAGNQNREAIGISGQKYDLSYMTSMAESADAALGDSQCVLSISNMVSRTANNIDTRTAAEKLFAVSNASGNFKFSVYFTKDERDLVIEVNKKIERRFKYELDRIRKMEAKRYTESAPELLKMAAARRAKSRIANELGVMDIPIRTWEDILMKCNCKANPVGINTIELAARASTRDQSLKVGQANAWGITEAGYEAATYNAAGTKTLPLFTDKQLEEAKKVSESIYNEFSDMYTFALANPVDFKGMFEIFCKCSEVIDKNVPVEYKPQFQVYGPEDKRKIEELSQVILNEAAGVEK